MISDSEDPLGYDEVNHGLSLVPNDISSRVSELSGKESVLRRFANKCKEVNVRCKA